MNIVEEMRASPDFARGRAEAETDIQAGILCQRAHGKLVAWWEDAAQVLKDRYGIQSKVVGWCITELSVAAAALGYNERMDEEIVARFRSDVVATTWREVERKVKKHGAGYTRRAERFNVSPAAPAGELSRSAAAAEARMRLAIAEDSEATALRDELADRAMDTDAAGLMTANAWLWSVESASSDPSAVVAALLGHPALPGQAWLEPGVGSQRWATHSAEAAAAVAVQLLTGGQSLEVPAFQHEPDAAARFVARLLTWVGHPVAAFGSTENRLGGVPAGFGLYRVPHWFDEGLVLVGPQRAAMLWFVGTD